MVCFVGWGVWKKGIEIEDVWCKQCVWGIFLDVFFSVMKCKVYIDCLSQNLVVIKLGIKEVDNVCGIFLFFFSFILFFFGIVIFLCLEYMDFYEVFFFIYVFKGMNLIEFNFFVFVRLKVLSSIQEGIDNIIQEVFDNISLVRGKEDVNKIFLNFQVVNYQ